jgi:hypothetical protein
MKVPIDENPTLQRFSAQKMEEYMNIYKSKVAIEMNGKL